MSQTRRRTWSLLMLTGLATTAGCASTVRCYTGNARHPNEVARVYTTGEVHVSAVDGEWGRQLRRGNEYTFAPPPKLIELPPGEHRLSVFYRRSEPGTMTSAAMHEESHNLMTIRHRFEAEKEYTFAVATIRGPTRPESEEMPPPEPVAVWQPVLVDKPSGAILAHLETDQAPPAPARSSHGATITGQAMLIDRHGAMRTATGREVVLLRNTRRNAYWVDKRAWDYEHKEGWFIRPRKLALDTEKLGSRHVLGYGMGQFQFDNVLPGEYLVLFEHGERIA